MLVLQPHVSLGLLGASLEATPNDALVLLALRPLPGALPVLQKLGPSGRNSAVRRATGDITFNVSGSPRFQRGTRIGFASVVPSPARRGGRETLWHP